MGTRTTHGSLLRSTMGRGKRATPVALAGFIRAQLDCGDTAAQLVGILPAGCAIESVTKVTRDGATPTTGTVVIEMPAVSAQSLSQADVVDSASITALGAFTTDTECRYKYWSYDREIWATITSGTAAEVLDLAIHVIPLDDGKESN